MYFFRYGVCNTLRIQNTCCKISFSVSFMVPMGLRPLRTISWILALTIQCLGLTSLVSFQNLCNQSFFVPEPLWPFLFYSRTFVNSLVLFQNLCNHSCFVPEPLWHWQRSRGQNGMEDEIRVTMQGTKKTFTKSLFLVPSFFFTLAYSRGLGPLR